MLSQRMRELCALSGISGREAPVRAYIREKLAESSVPMTVRVDPLGNLIVALKGQERPPVSVAFAAHMDEVGLMVTGVTEDGFLRFATVGGVADTVLFGRRVMVNGHPGVIGGKAVHQCEKEEKSTVPSAEQLRIDLGVDTRQEALQLARPGDSAVFAGEPVTLAGGKIKAKAIDDRGGCALLLALAEVPPRYDITLIFTVQEEVGLRGARTAAFATAPEIAVIVDATTASDTVSVPADKEVCRQGHGGVLSFMDRATVYDKALFDGILEEAARENLPVQVKEAIAGGNDAGSFQTAGSGVRVAALSLPCRYIHSPSCVLSESDLADTARLLRHLADRLPEGFA